MKRWSKTDMEKIYALRKNNCNFYYIANYFNVTINSLRKALRRHDVRYVKNITKSVNPENIIKNNYMYSGNGNYLDIIKLNMERKKQLLPILRV